MVFIHGALHDHSVLDLQSALAARTTAASVLAVDLPGHGRSAGAPLPASRRWPTGWLALLDASRRAAAAALVGHSMGSLIALEAAAHAAPERVTRTGDGGHRDTR